MGHKAFSDRFEKSAKDKEPRGMKEGTKREERLDRKQESAGSGGISDKSAKARKKD